MMLRSYCIYEFDVVVLPLDVFTVWVVGCSHGHVVQLWCSVSAAFVSSWRGLSAFDFIMSIVCM
jgi:hypothetical protein